MRQAREAALRAIDLAPDQPAGHYVLALLESHFFWNWNQADTFFRRAVDLNPSDVITHAWYAIFLGRWPELYEQAIERVREALGKDPVCFEANLFKAHIEGLGGRTDRAIDGYRRTSELYPNIALPHIYLSLVLAALDEGEEALESARRAHALTPADPVVAATIATGLASAGDREAARAHLQALLKGRDLSYVQPTFVAFAWIGLDEFDFAFDWLERAYRERDSMLTYLPATPYAEKLHRDPRFDSLIGRIGLRPPAAFAVAAGAQQGR